MYDIRNKILPLYAFRGLLGIRATRPPSIFTTSTLHQHQATDTDSPQPSIPGAIAFTLTNENAIDTSSYDTCSLSPNLSTKSPSSTPSHAFWPRLTRNPGNNQHARSPGTTRRRQQRRRNGNRSLGLPRDPHRPHRLPRHANRRRQERPNQVQARIPVHRKAPAPHG